MPSLEHEEIVELFSRDLTLALELAKATGKAKIPTFATLEAAPGDARELVPTSLRVDVVLVLRNQASEPVHVVLVEVQLGRDHDKPYTWPYYATSARLRYRCPATLLVYAPDLDIRQWCARPIDLGQPGSPFLPLVVGPAQVPRIANPGDAKVAPYRALLSAFAHGNESGGEAVVQAAVAGLSQMGEDERGVWIELLWASLDEAVRNALERTVHVNEEFKQQLPFYKEGLTKGLRAAVSDLCELLGVDLTEARKTHLQGLDLAGLEALRQHLKLHRAWPT